jgi:HSP20 family protein
MNTKEKSQVVPFSTKGGLLSFDEFDHFFDDFLSRRWPRLRDWSFPVEFEKGMPKVDILDHDKEIEVQAALPGVNKEDLEVTVTDQSINIRATTKKEEKKEDKRYFRREIMRGEFQRTLALPENVDSNNAKASFKDGMLKVTIPKTEKTKRKSIEIK